MQFVLQVVGNGIWELARERPGKRMCDSPGAVVPMCDLDLLLGVKHGPRSSPQADKASGQVSLWEGIYGGPAKVSIAQA